MANGLSLAERSEEGEWSLLGCRSTNGLMNSDTRYRLQRSRFLLIALWCLFTVPRSLGADQAVLHGSGRIPAGDDRISSWRPTRRREALHGTGLHPGVERSLLQCGATSAHRRSGELHGQEAFRCLPAFPGLLRCHRRIPERWSQFSANSMRGCRAWTSWSKSGRKQNVVAFIATCAEPLQGQHHVHQRQHAMAQSAAANSPSSSTVFPRCSFQ